jgi:GH35 family endo-1,4-beta-xylanase
MSDLSHRKGSRTLHFTDKAGHALANTDLTVRQTGHEFLFGCGAFDALGATATAEDMARFPADKAEAFRAMSQDRMKKWQDVFNYGTIPFYWGQFEPKEGEPQTESRRRAAEFLRKGGARVKGHPLCWHTVCADWLMDYDNATILQKQLDRIYRDVTEFKGIVDIWDVINEVVIMPVFDKYDNAVTRICKDLGRVRLVKEVFDAAHAANPDAMLLINDFNLSESYRILIDGCLNAGVPISAIGIQTHQHQGYMGRKKLEDVLERFSFFGLPLHFTENTLVSGEIMPPDIVDLNDYQVDEWPTTPEGEERQKKEWAEMYQILFEHPLVEAVTGWDFADGAWLGAPSGLIRKDGSLKPSYLEIRRLIKEEWSTDLTVRTDAQGNASVEGFKGDYEVTADGKTGTFAIGKAAKGASDTVYLA